MRALRRAINNDGMVVVDIDKMQLARASTVCLNNMHFMFVRVCFEIIGVLY